MPSLHGVWTRVMASSRARPTSWGRIVIRSAYRSCEVNAFCNDMQRQKKPGYTCASNKQNYAAHIWVRLDANGYMGAMACVAVPRFWKSNHSEGDCRILAR